MSIPAGTIYVNLDLDTGKFRQGVVESGTYLRKLERDIGQTSKAVDRIDGHFSSLTTKLRHTVLTVASVKYAFADLNDVLLAGPAAVMKTSGEFERLTQLMKGLSKESTEAGRIKEAGDNVAYLVERAKTAPFAITALSDALVKVKTATSDNGKARRWVDALTDGVAKFGGTSDVMHRASISIQQMASKGVISMEELRQQLGEAVPDAMQTMADSMGMSMGELIDHVSKGEVLAGPALDRMFTLMKYKNEGAALDMMNTWTGMTSLMATEWELLKKAVADNGFATRAKDALQGLIDFSSTDDARKAADALGSFLAGATDSAISLAKGMATLTDELKTFGTYALAYYTVSRGRSLLGGMLFGAEGREGIVSRYKSALAEANAGKLAVLESSKAYALSQIALEKRGLEAGREKNLQILANARKTHVEISASAKLAAAEEIAVARAKHAELVALEKATQAQIQAARVEAAASAAATSTRTTSGLGSAVDAVRQRENLKAAQLASQVDRAREREILASQERIKQSHVATSNVIVASQGRATAAIATSGAQMKATAATARASFTAIGTSILSAETRMKALQLTTVALSGVTRAASATMSAAGLAFSALGGWVTVANLALMAGVTWLMKYKSAADRASDSANRLASAKRGLASAEDQVENRKEAAALKEENRLAKETLAARNFDPKKAPPGPRKILKQDTAYLDMSDGEIKAKIAERDKQLSDLAESMKLGEENIFKQKAGDDQSLYDRRAQEMLDKVGKRHASAMAKADATGQIKLAKRIATEKLDAMARLGEMQVKNLTKMQADKNAKPEQIEGLKNHIEDIKRQEAELRALVTQTDELGTSVLGGGKDKGGKDKAVKAPKQTADDRLELYIQGITNDVGALREELDKGADKKIQKLLEQLDDKRFAGASSTMLAKAKAEIAELGNLTTRKDEEKVSGKLLDAAKDKLAALDAEAQDASTTFRILGDDIEKALANTKTPDAKKELEEAKAIAALATKKYKDKEEEKATVSASSYAKEAASIYRELSTNRIQALQEEFNAEKALRQEQLENEYKDLDAKKIAQEGYHKWLTARQAKLAVDSKTPAQQLAHNWQQTTTNMEAAAARWSDSVMDAISTMVTTGKADWRSLTVSILSDMAKVNMQKAIGSYVTKGMDALGSGLSSLLGGNTQTSGAGAGAAPAAGGAVTSAASNAASQALQNLAAQSTAAAATTTAMSTGVNATTTAVSAMATTGIAPVVTGMVTQAAGSMTVATVDTALVSVSTVLAEVLLQLGTSAASAIIQIEAAQAAATVASAFADGGIMSSSGSLPLAKYANGGIANSPQLALFGEGRMNEAYVPLPDGRSIPVTMKGGGGTNNAVVININVANNGSEKKDSKGDNGKGAWTELANKVKAMILQELVEQKRPGGVLYG